jgi:riboflavin kinase/FMN adenylyltransferase
MPDHGLPAMDVVPGIDALERSFGRLFIVIGVFDGLHLGHLYLLNYLKEAAAERAARSTVITFDHHPDEVLTGAAPPLLCDPDERLELLASAGVEVTVVQHFDLALRMTSFEDFVRRIADRVTLMGFLMTPDSAFGNERRGTPEAVAELGRSMGYDTIVVPSLDLAGRPVRSAEIRADIAAGDLAGATSLLGRRYSVVGRVATGTATAPEFTVPMPVALPPAGTYGAWISTDGADDGRPGTMSIDASGRLLLDGPGMGDAAGRRVRVTFAPGGRLPDPDVAATIRRS